MVKVFRPTDLQEILIMRNSHHAIPFAGGTDLMVRFRKGAGVPAALKGPVLFLDRCESLKQIRSSEEGLEIGAGASMAALSDHLSVPAALKSVLSEIAAPALRNLATVGGNICNASPAADTLPFLYAFDAVLSLRSINGERRLPVEQFVTGPGATVIREDEIVTSIFVPRWEPAIQRFRKVGTRKANALTKVSFAGYADVEAGKVARIALAVGSVGLTVIRLREVEARCIGVDASGLSSMVSELQDLLRRAIHPIDDQRSTARYREKVAGNLFVNFLREDLSGALA